MVCPLGGVGTLWNSLEFSLEFSGIDVKLGVPGVIPEGEKISLKIWQKFLGKAGILKKDYSIPAPLKSLGGKEFLVLPGIGCCQMLGILSQGNSFGGICRKKGKGCARITRSQQGLFLLLEFCPGSVGFALTFSSNIRPVAPSGDVGWLSCPWKFSVGMGNAQRAQGYPGGLLAWVQNSSAPGGAVSVPSSDPKEIPLENPSPRCHWGLLLLLPTHWDQSGNNGAGVGRGWSRDGQTSNPAEPGDSLGAPGSLISLPLLLFQGLVEESLPAPGGTAPRGAGPWGKVPGAIPRCDIPRCHPQV
ncbi:uncharacterized protein LOC130263824 isoform X2 [Oenanthe melanoleuca]|uniref:uncharacterized protein LOC130263824 isoform X2 n=1 Tax=Oenanthe melanoleuca TaxID=2939378 RepID=UPI0024C0F6EF|nr:uncharacterized protein LOC130263824 isoform X2 [Oenanthe melanoleuca]